MARRALVVLLAALLTLCSAAPAGTVVTVDAWVLAGDGSAHVVLDDNHLVAQRLAGGPCCTSLGYPRDDYLPWFCYVQRVDAGGPGPALVWIGAAVGQNCWPGYDSSAYAGWTNGFGYFEGQAYGWGIRRAWGSGTVIEIW